MLEPINGYTGRLPSTGAKISFKIKCYFLVLTLRIGPEIVPQFFLQNPSLIFSLF